MLVWLANSFSEEGFDVTFLTYRDGTEYQKISSSVKHVHVQLENVSGHGNNMLRTVLFLHRFINREKIDVVISFLRPSQMRVAIASVGTKSKVLYSHRGDPFRQSTSIIGRIIEKINECAFKTADAFVFQTEQAKNYYPNKIRKKSVVIANPIIPLNRTIPRIGHVEPIIVSMSRLDINQKRQDLLIKAFLMISDKYPDYHLLIYGDGDDEQRLRGMTENNKQIVFKGKTSKISDVIQNAAMFVLSSDFEGIPNALLEAMSLGVPCISTDCSPGGAAMLIQNKLNGLLVPRGDVAALADAMSWYIENPEKRELFGVEGMIVNDRFAEKILRQEWIKVLKKLQ